MDSSALAAILLDEPQAEAISVRLDGYDTLLTGAPTLVEIRIALTRRLARDARPEIDEIVRRFRITVVPFGPVHAEIAQDAYLRYGKGRHPASLNFGDCMAYAIAKIARAELVYVGDDFDQTDLAYTLGLSAPNE